jgi:hypothetical protein
MPIAFGPLQDALNRLIAHQRSMVATHGSA